MIRPSFALLLFLLHWRRFDRGDIDKRKIARHGAFIIDDQPRRAFAAPFINRLYIRVMGRLDIVAVTGRKHDDKGHERHGILIPSYEDIEDRTPEKGTRDLRGIVQAFFASSDSR